MDLAAYALIGEKIFGRNTGLWTVGNQCGKSQLTREERDLLNAIPSLYPGTTMPPTLVQNPSKKKVRPSSAAANLQSHPSYSTDLYGDDTRPSTAAPVNAGKPSRPKTQAGGPRFWNSSKKDDPKNENNKQQRRLTIGPADCLDDSDLHKRGPVGHTVGQLLKGKVSIKLIYFMS